MTLPREKILEHLLGEASPEEARAIEAAVARDAGAAAVREVYGRAVALLRAAAAEAWEAREPGRARRYLGLAAAVLLAVAGVLLLRGRAPAPAAVYEPDVAFGYLRGEETDARGGVPRPASGEGFHLRAGTARAAPLGGEAEAALGPGDPIAPETRVEPAAGPVRVDLPRGGILFATGDAEFQLRHRADGRAAVRLVLGAAAVVAGEAPVHLAVDGTDLLLVLEAGACLLRRDVPDAVCLRGTLFLDAAGGGLFRVPEGHRLPAQCATAPRTAAVPDEEVDLDWYYGLVYAACEVEALRLLERADGSLGATLPAPAPGSHLYLRLVPTEGGAFVLRLGAFERRYRLRPDEPFRLRVPAAAGALVLELPGAASGLKEARVARLTPRE